MIGSQETESGPEEWELRLHLVNSLNSAKPFTFYHMRCWLQAGALKPDAGILLLVFSFANCVSLVELHDVFSKMG